MDQFTPDLAMSTEIWLMTSKLQGLSQSQPHPLKTSSQQTSLGTESSGPGSMNKNGEGLAVSIYLVPPKYREQV